MPKQTRARIIDSAYVPRSGAIAMASSPAGSMSAHELGGALHSGMLPWTKVDKAGSSLSDFASRNIGNHAIAVCDFVGSVAPSNGYLITTNIPFTQFAMPTVIVEGYAYNSAQPIQMTINWHVSPQDLTSGAFVQSACHCYGWDPGTVKLAINTSNNIVIHLSNSTYYARFSVRVIADSLSTGQLSGWTVSDTVCPASKQVLVSKMTGWNSANHGSSGDPHAQYLDVARGDARYFTESESDARFVNVTGDTMTGTLQTPGIGIGTSSSSSYPLRLYKNYDNSSGALYYSTLDQQVSSSGTYYNLGGVFEVRSFIAAGATNSGYQLGFRNSALRDQPGDGGTLTYLIGQEIQLGHYSTLPATARTTSATGIQISPYALAGTIDTMYGIRIYPRGGGGTVGEYYAFYQQDTGAKNYFDGTMQLMGNVGINTLSPSERLHVTGNIAISGSIVPTTTNLNVSGAATLNDWLYAKKFAGGNQPLIRSRGMGYSQAAYPGVQIGQQNDHIALFIDPASVTGGSFSGASNEIVLPNSVTINQANSSGTDWLWFAMTMSNGNIGINTTAPTEKLHVGGNVLATGTLSAGDNTATTHALGMARVGEMGFGSLFAGFAHRSMASAGNYAILQSSTGQTYLNAASGQTIYHRINNADIFTVNAASVLYQNLITVGTTSFGGFPTLGWRISLDSNNNQHTLGIGKITADELRVRLFVADETRIDRGEEWWVRGYGILNADFITPAINGSVETWWENSPQVAGAIFQDGEYVLLRLFDDSGSGLTVLYLWGQVYSAASGAVNGYLFDAANKRQRWRFVLRSGSTSYTMRKGVIAVGFGLSGQSYIRLSTIDPNGAPYIEFGRWVTDPSYASNQLRTVRLGNLRNTIDYTTNSDGLVTGNNIALTPASGFSGITSDAVNGVRMFNANTTWYIGGVPFVRINPSIGIDIQSEQSGSTWHDYKAYTFSDSLGQTYSGYYAWKWAGSSVASRIYTSSINLPVQSEVYTYVSTGNSTATSQITAYNNGYAKIAQIVATANTTAQITLLADTVIVATATATINNTAFTAAWSSLANASQSEISNDLSSYKALMLAGNTSAGNERVVKIWDRMSVNWNAPADHYSRISTQYDGGHFSIANSGWGYSTSLLFNAYKCANSADITVYGQTRYAGLNYNSGGVLVSRPLMFHAEPNSGTFYWRYGPIALMEGAVIPSWTTTMTLAYDQLKVDVNAVFNASLSANGTIVEPATGVEGVRMGVKAGTPCIIWEDAGFTQWEIDNSGGLLRFFNPGSVKATLDTSGVFTAGAIRTGSNLVWDLGGYNTTAPSATGYITVIVSGTTYKLLAST